MPRVRAKGGKVKERPILFSGAMVRAIREDRKTKTRRIAKWKPREAGADLTASGLQVGYYSTGDPASGFVLRSIGGSCWNDRTFPLHCPFGKPGDRLWVRECWSDASGSNGDKCALYRATYKGHSGIAWKPSIHMPRWASRITLEITNVRIERLNEISEADAKAEGVELTDDLTGVAEDLDGSYAKAFRILWDSINSKKHPWASNPCVWVVEFHRIEDAE